MAGWQCRWSPTLGELESSHQQVWGTDDYIDDIRPTVFMGLYSLPDFYALWRHKGQKAILWCGSDIRHFKDGYWLDSEGKIRIRPLSLALWINEYCESWVENEVERQALKSLNIQTQICPSFLGDVKKFQLSYKSSSKPKVYSSVSGDDFDLYRWDEIVNLAKRHTDIEFHLYGNSKKPPYKFNKNVVVHGRVSKEKMNNEIKNMQGALRLLPFEGFSEIIAKSVLMGQWPISAIKYSYMLSVEDLGLLKSKNEPNLRGRNYYINELNRYPWNTNI